MRPPGESSLCMCDWARVFEGERSGDVWYLTGIHRRCPLHGHKPRRKKLGNK